jgi:hypothetical protein
VFVVDSAEDYGMENRFLNAAWVREGRTGVGGAGTEGSQVGKDSIIQGQTTYISILKSGQR